MPYRVLTSIVESGGILQKIALMKNEALFRVPFTEVQVALYEILLTYGFSEDGASLSARLFAETTRDGVYSHGLNRFPRFIETIKKGYVVPQNEPVVAESFDSHDVWDGQLGPGNLNAYKAMDRALLLAKNKGVGIVAMRNTNHWMRGGTYGWQAAEAGCAAVCFTNTEPNMPPWGGTLPKIGNNPLIIAVPDNPNHLVLDMAMSQFSFGKMENLKLMKEELPYDGGFSKEGSLTRDPEKILDSRRPIPAGFWKGSGLSMMLDLLVTIMSGGNSTADIGKKKAEYAVSQFFMAIDLSNVNRSAFAAQVVEQLKQEVHAAAPMDAKGKIYYPGERTILTRKKNMEQGLPVNRDVWNQIISYKQ